MSKTRDGSTQGIAILWKGGACPRWAGSSSCEWWGLGGPSINGLLGLGYHRQCLWGRFFFSVTLLWGPFLREVVLVYVFPL